MINQRLETVLVAIDAANAKDPNQVQLASGARPAELLYGERMSRALGLLYPEASEELQIAARGQHIERWTSPRNDFPQGREGYLRWRTALKAYHARRVAEIMTQCGYGEAAANRVGDLIRKRRLKQDPEVQALEDVVCVVFLEDYFADFARQHEEEKVLGILRKTWAKMSPIGQGAALDLKLSQAARYMLDKALSGDAPMPKSRTTSG